MRGALHDYNQPTITSDWGLLSLHKNIIDIDKIKSHTIKHKA